MTLRDALAAGQKALSGHGCGGTDPGRETELLLGKASGLSREAILTSPERPLTAAQVRAFRSYISRRRGHEPLAYILGTAWFRGLEFAVTRDTLIPRPATETVVDAAIGVCGRHSGAAVFDIGTGSGCAAIALAQAVPGTRVTGLDISAAALKIARKNAAGNQVADRVSFRRSDLLTGLNKDDADAGRPVIIVANLPYLPTAMIAGLAPEIRDHEPAAALDGGPDGLDLCRRLIGQAAALFADRDLHLLLEILPEQYGPLSIFAQKKIPGLRAENIFNLSGVCVGAALSAGCASG